MPSQARLDAPGTLHHVIIRGIEKKNIVTNQYDRKDFVERLGLLATETETVIYAWALLSNHAHILLRSSDAGLAHFMRRLLTGYAINYNLRHKRHGHLFQNRYKSIICEEVIWSSKNGHPVKRLLPKENYSQKHLDFCIPKTNGDGGYYKTFRYT